MSSDGLGFEVKYILDTTLANAVHVNSDEKTLTFTISGPSETDQITLILPEELIENPNSIWVDGEMVANFQKKLYKKHQKKFRNFFFRVLDNFKTFEKKKIRKKNVL